MPPILYVYYYSTWSANFPVRTVRSKDFQIGLYEQIETEEILSLSTGSSIYVALR